MIINVMKESRIKGIPVAFFASNGVLNFVAKFSSLQLSSKI